MVSKCEAKEVSISPQMRKSVTPLQYRYIGSTKSSLGNAVFYDIWPTGKMDKAGSVCHALLTVPLFPITYM